MASATGRKIVIGAAQWFIRIALAAGFLSAVADRFGLWGPPGATNVAWGNWQHFVQYVAVLNGFAPAALVSALAWLSTLAEVVVAIGLLVGRRLRWFSFAAGLLLLLFALAMSFSTGVKSALDASVFAASAGAFLLAATLQPASLTKSAPEKNPVEIKRETDPETGETSASIK